jgi:hypothetical protein
MLLENSVFLLALMPAGNQDAEMADAREPCNDRLAMGLISSTSA